MIGRVFLGRYEVKRLLGEGGMGRVYLAEQVDLARQVVVKVMHDHIASDPKFRDRFQRETLLMARFQHPFAVTLYDASLNDPAGPCIVMEYVKGRNLETILGREKRFTASRVLRFIAPLCDVLHAAHEEGIIHRDLKPANLMIVDPETPRERVKVMDFGLAKLIESGLSNKVTDTNIDFAVGTPGYIAPEQVRGEVMDHRGDLYSVGVMMYELLSGKLPFQGTNSMDVLLAHATETPPTFAELGLSGWVPPAVEELVFDLLAKDPVDRPQSARELETRFRSALESESRHGSSDSGDGKYIKLEKSDSAHAELVQLQPAGSSQETHRSLAGSNASLQTREHPSQREAGALPFNMEAWMPEVIAIRKLRGFVHDCGGEVLESVPGLIRVRLGKSQGAGSISWLRFGNRAAGPIDVELHMHSNDPRQENRLTIHVLFRASHAGLLADEMWRTRCERIFVELRAYLMGNPSV